MITSTLDAFELKSKYKKDGDFWHHQIKYKEVIVQYKNRMKPRANQEEKADFYPAYEVKSNQKEIRGKSAFKTELYKLVPKEKYQQIQKIQYDKISTKVN